MSNVNVFISAVTCYYYNIQWRCPYIVISYKTARVDLSKKNRIFTRKKYWLWLTVEAISYIRLANPLGFSITGYRWTSSPRITVISGWLSPLWSSKNDISRKKRDLFGFAISLYLSSNHSINSLHDNVDYWQNKCLVGIQGPGQGPNSDGYKI